VGATFFEGRGRQILWYMDIAIERGFPLRYNMVTRAATQILEALAQGKKPRGRKRKIKAINTQMTQGDI